MSKFNQQQMFERILHWQQSGLTQKAWCEQNNIAYSSFHYWYGRFRNQHTTTGQSDEGFVQLLVQEGFSGRAWCELALTNGKRLLFHQPVSAPFIRSLLD